MTEDERLSGVNLSSFKWLLEASDISTEHAFITITLRSERTMNFLSAEALKYKADDPSPPLRLHPQPCPFPPPFNHSSQKLPYRL